MFKRAVRTMMLVIPLFTAGCREEILHQLDEWEANDVLVYLQQRGVEGEKSASGDRWSISVPRRDGIKALQALSARRPLQARTAQEPELDGGLFAGKSERQLSLERHLAARLENSLLEIPGVRGARVHLYLGEKGSAARAAVDSRGSASVLLVSDRPVDTQAVRDLVGGAVGISFGDVSVIRIDAADSPPESIAPAVKEAREEKTKLPDLTSIAGDRESLMAVILFCFLLLIGAGVVSRQRERRVKGDTINQSQRRLRPA